MMKFLARSAVGRAGQVGEGRRGKPAPRSREGLLAVDIEREVLGLYLLVLAIGADGIDGRVQARGVRGVTLAQGDTGAPAEVFRVVDVAADQREAFTRRGFDKALVGVDDVGEGGIQATRRQVKKGLVL